MVRRRWGKIHPDPDAESSSAKDDLEAGTVEAAPSEQPEAATPPNDPTPSRTAPPIQSAALTAVVPSALPAAEATAALGRPPSAAPGPVPFRPGVPGEPPRPGPIAPSAPSVPSGPPLHGAGGPPAPAAPGAPSGPPLPGGPVLPAAPRVPSGPPAPGPIPPVAPGAPSGPPLPGGPVLPAAPRVPSGPPAPIDPTAPAVPSRPSAPRAQSTDSAAAERSAQLRTSTAVRHGECTINGQVKKYAFLPSAAKATKFDIQSLLAVWKLPLPNLVMQLNSHHIPSSHLVSREMLETVPEFQHLKTRLSKPDLSLADVNKVVEDQADSILSAVGVALSMSDSFILLKGAPKTNHYMLGRALERSKASPPIIAVDSLGAHRSYSAFASKDEEEEGEWTKINRGLEKWATDLWQNAVPLNQPLKGERAEINIGGRDGRDGKIPEWKPLKEAPKGLHKESQDKDVMEDQVVPCTPWTSATHYIFVNDINDFNPSLLGNHGLMSLGGDGGHPGGLDLGFGFQLREALERGYPTILVNNTGGETQQYARLLKKIWEHQKKGDGDDLVAHAQDLLDHALKGITTNSVTTKELEKPFLWDNGFALGVEALNLPEVLRVIKMVQDRPKYFRDTLKIVDVLTDTPEHVIREASNSFASRATHACELGGGNADEKAIQCAWQVHVALIRLGERLKRWDHFVIFCTALVTFLGSATSVLVTWAKSKEAPLEFCHTATCAAWLRRAAVIFPALATALIAFVAAMRFTSRVAHLKSLAGRVVAEIYKFRMRVEVYDLLGMRSFQPTSVRDPNLEEDEAKQNVSLFLHESRTRFSTTIRNMVEETAKRMAGGFVIDSRGAFTIPQLQPHVNKSCYGISEYSAKTKQRELVFFACSCLGKTKQREQTKPTYTKENKTKKTAEHTTLSSDSYHFTTEYSAKDTDKDDLTSNLSSDSYYHFRIVPLLAFYRRQTPWLARIDLFLNAMLMVLTTLATVLAAMDQAIFVPLVFAAAALLKSLQEYGAFNARLVATTNAVADLTSLEVFWASLSEVDKGLSSTRCDLVSFAERAALSVLVAETGEAQFFEGDRMPLLAGKEIKSKKPEAKQEKAG